MAGLFSSSKKNKKDRDDSSSPNPPYQSSRPSNSSNGTRDNFRDNASAANSTTHSHYSEHSHQAHSPYHFQHHNSSSNIHNGPSVYSSKSSLQHQHSNQQQLHYQPSNMNSATSFSTHHSVFASNGPWSSALVMSTNPFPRFAHTASFVTTGTDIYVFGGIVKGLPQKDVHVIDPQSLHCQLLPVGGDSPQATNGHTAVTLGQYIMYFGGKDAKGKSSDTLYVLHTGRKQWNKPSIQTLLPAPRHSHAACVVGTVMYIIGGQLSGYYMNDIAAFDMKSLNGKLPSWSVLEPKSDLPPARAGHCAASYDGKIYIFGGADVQYYYNDIWCYDPQTNRWEAVPAYGTLPTSRQGHTVAVIDDVMYIHGGMNFEDQLLGDLCAFRFTERRWITFPNTIEAASPRTEHAMCSVGEKLYILGGQLDLNTNEDVGSIFVLDTAKIRWNDSSVAGSQRSAYDNDSMLRVDGGHDGRGSPYSRPSPTPEYTRYPSGPDPIAPYSEDSRRATVQQLQQLPLQDRADQYSNYQEQHQQQRPYAERMEMNGSRTGFRSTDESHVQGVGHPSSQSPLPTSLSRPSVDLNESMHVARRRTIGKPAGYIVQDVEPHRGTHSIDEGRRPGAGFENESMDRPSLAHSQSQPELQSQSRSDPMQRQLSSAQSQNYDYSVSEDRSYSQHQQQQQQQQLPQGDRGRQYGSNNNSNNLAVGFSHLGLSRQESIATNTTMTDSLHRQGSLAESLNRQGSLVDSINRESYTSISNLQPTARSSVDPMLRVPLRVTNPDGDGRDRLEQGLGQHEDESQRTMSHHGHGSNGYLTSVSSKAAQVAPKESKELKDLKQREQWLLAEVSMARKKMGERPLSMAIMALEDELEACEVDSEKYRIMQALLNVKLELEQSKTSIATQAQIASNKVREAERVRTSALQEAAYFKAKLNALQTGEVSALVATETARATDLERRLTVALAQLDQYEARFVEYETVLEHEKESRLMAESRAQEASSRAEEAQLAHTRALNDLTTLHERATIAEAGLRESAVKSATNEAGLSSYQQQSAALLSQISTLKTTTDHQKKSLDKAKLAYTVANERAEQADNLWTQSRQEMDQIQLEMARVRADLDRAQRESDHWRSKASETELLWQKAKKENETMRTLLEEDINAAYTTTTTLSKERKHDSIMAITSASRVSELEHELSTLRELLRNSQGAATQANRDLGDTMVRISQLEQSSMTARAEAATAQRQLTEAREKVAMLQAQLIRKEDSVEEMAREQENNEVQLGLLRGVMKEHGLLADDLILEALSQNAEGRATTALPLKAKIQEAERRADDAEKQLQELVETKRSQEERIQQLEADYQTAVHYVEGTESMLQRLRNEKETLRGTLKELEDTHSHCVDHRGSKSMGESTVELEEEAADLHRQLHAAHERSLELESQMEKLSSLLQSTESGAEVSRIELQSMKAKQQEQKKRGVNQTDPNQSRVMEQLEQSLAETRHRLEKTLEDLDHTQELNRVTGQELEDALDALKRNNRPADVSSPNGHAAASPSKRQEELEDAIDHAQRTIRSLQQTNQNLEEQLRASENKISLLLDNFQAPESVRNSVASLSGLTGGNGGGFHGLNNHHGLLSSMSPSSPPLSASVMMAGGGGDGSAAGLRASLSQLSSPPPTSIAARSISPTSPAFKPHNKSQSSSRSVHGSGSHGVGASDPVASVGSLTNSQKLEEYEKLIDEMTNARRQYEE